MTPCAAASAAAGGGGVRATAVHAAGAASVLKPRAAAGPAGDERERDSSSKRASWEVDRRERAAAGVRGGVVGVALAVAVAV